MARRICLHISIIVLLLRVFRIKLITAEPKTAVTAVFGSATIICVIIFA